MSAAAESEKVAAAFEHCRSVCRQRARNFYYGLKLSPEPQRSALFAVYAWMRAADDLVDATAHLGATHSPLPKGEGVLHTNNMCGMPDPHSDGLAVHAQIEEFRRATEAALHGRPISDDPLWIAMAETVERFDLPHEHFHSMLDGQLDDLQRREYRTFDELHTYCYRVASTVGLVCIEIWGYENPAARNLAMERGIAFQLTNILRDYRQDFDGGRVYLPSEELARHELDPRALRNWAEPRKCKDFMLEQIARAKSYYDASSGLEMMIAPACRPTIWAMTAIYRGLLAKMERDPSKIIFRKRVRLSAWRKAMIAAQAKWLARSARRERLAAPVQVTESASA